MNVAIIGAGLMGSGIAQVFLVAGHDVIVHDRDQGALEESSNRIRDIYGLLKLEPDLDRLVLEEDLQQAVTNADFVIEAVIEDLEAKKDLFSRLSESAPAEAILASNTSAIPITLIAAGAIDPPAPCSIRRREICATSSTRSPSASVFLVSSVTAYS